MCFAVCRLHPQSHVAVVRGFHSCEEPNFFDVDLRYKRAHRLTKTLMELRPVTSLLRSILSVIGMLFRRRLSGEALRVMESAFGVRKRGLMESSCYLGIIPSVDVDYAVYIG